MKSKMIIELFRKPEKISFLNNSLDCNSESELKNICPNIFCSINKEVRNYKETTFGY